MSEKIEIPGYPGNYVSTEGKVVTIEGNDGRPKMTNPGMSVSINNKRMLLNKLIIEAFKPKAPLQIKENSVTIKHIDTDSANCNVNNVVYSDGGKNVQWGILMYNENPYVESIEVKKNGNVTYFNNIFECAKHLNIGIEDIWKGYAYNEIINGNRIGITDRNHRDIFTKAQVNKLFNVDIAVYSFYKKTIEIINLYEFSEINNIPPSLVYQAIVTHEPRNQDIFMGIWLIADNEDKFNDIDPIIEYWEREFKEERFIAMEQNPLRFTLYKNIFEFAEKVKLKTFFGLDKETITDHIERILRFKDGIGNIDGVWVCKVPYLELPRKEGYILYKFKGHSSIEPRVAPLRINPSYMIDTDGRIFDSLGNKVVSNANTWAKDYGQVQLNGVKESQFIHKLVLETFEPLDLNNGVNKERTIGNHFDGDRKNNRLNNLDWCTPTENNIHGSINNPRSIRERIAITNSLSNDYIEKFLNFKEAANYLKVTSREVWLAIKDNKPIGEFNVVHIPSSSSEITTVINASKKRADKSSGDDRPVLVLDITTGIVKEYKCCREVSIKIGNSDKSGHSKERLSNPEFIHPETGKTIPKNVRLYQKKYIIVDKEIGFGFITDEDIENAKKNGGIALKIIAEEISTDNKKVFDSIAKAAKWLDRTFGGKNRNALYNGLNKYGKYKYHGYVFYTIEE